MLEWWSDGRIVQLHAELLGMTHRTSTWCCRDYNSVCPNTWQVVNSTDIVPRIGKFGRLYKHPGQRVIIDRKGSILVRPSPLELHLRQGKRP